MKTEIVFRDPVFFSDKSGVYASQHRRRIMILFMAVSDILSVVMSSLISILIWEQVRLDLQVEAHLTIILPLVLFFILINQSMGLYPAVGIGPVEELRRLTIGSFMVMLVFMTLSFFLRNTTLYSRAALMISWFLITMSIPLFRKVFRRIAVRLGFWGIPIVVAGSAKNVARFHKRLSLHPLSGLWPVLGIAGQVEDVFPRENHDLSLFAQIHTVVLVTDQGKLDSVRHLMTQKQYRFKHIFVVFDETRMGPIWFKPVSIVEHMGFEVPHNLLDSTQQFVKRLTEIGLIIVAFPILVIVFAGIAIVIKTTSPGPVFYKHRRIGLNGSEMWIWKFRTMVYNADAVLENHLKEDPVMQTEWDKNFKLRADPRVTRIGGVLRRTSLDELPQLWNVFRGEMSLIGPRPIVKAEISLYGDDFEIYKQVLPGITGLWQISGRNDLPYEDRVALDIYYIQNWSIWLDLHILMHTVLATLQARGAY